MGGRKQPSAYALDAMGLGMGCSTEKEIQDGVGVGGRFAYGIAAMQGWRDAMEDAHLAIPDFDLKRNIALFGVFDGHGGAAVAEVVADKLPATLRNSPAYERCQYEEAVDQAFRRLDIYLGSSEGQKDIRRRGGGEGPLHMGCTAVVALIRRDDDGKGQELLVANVGDSRCVIVSGSRAVDMSIDHKPTLPAERLRVRRAGGFVTGEGRINGNLNLSRALGDLFYKRNINLKPEQQLISGVPQIKRRIIGPLDRYLILGCDGIWERFSSQSVARFCIARLVDQAKRPVKLSTVCGAFLDQNVSKNPLRTEGLGCDNMTLLVVDLLSGDRLGKPQCEEVDKHQKAEGTLAQRSSAAESIPEANSIFVENLATNANAKSEKRGRRLQSLAWHSRSQRRRLTLVTHQLLKC